MAYCWKCGEKLEERIIYTPKTHKEKGREFYCSVHGIEQKPYFQYVGRENPHNKGGRDWGTSLRQ